MVGDEASSVSEPPARSYPEPPWHTHGFGVMCPYAVRADQISLPPGLELVSAAGRTAGVLAYIEYQPPSPLSYAELIWMPAMVRYPLGSGRPLSGHFVARMYVDNDASLAAGRELWALPKTKARFERRERGVDVFADDGTELSLDFRALGPALALKSRVATLQPIDRGVVRFRADFLGRVRLARAKVTRFSSTHSAWKGFEVARRPLGIASYLERFESTMQPPMSVTG